MGKESAGLLVYRRKEGALEFLLAHPGGPFWKNKDAGAWTIPKGEVREGEIALEAAKREFKEELGFEAAGTFVELAVIKQKGGKLVRAWAIEKDYDLAQARSNTFEMEWPPKSGMKGTFPEVDRVEYLGMADAQTRINPAQIALLEEVARHQ